MGSAQLWREWCQNTSLHGPGDFQRASNCCEKLLWIFLTVFALAAVGIQGFGFVTEFFDPKNEWTSVVTYEAPSDGQGLPLPNVTVCNINWINMTRLTERDSENRTLEGLFHVQDLIYANIAPTPSVFAGLKSNKDKYEELVKRRPEFGSLRSMISGMALSNCEDVMVLCIINAGISSTWDCCSAVMTVETIRGVCFTFVPQMTKDHNNSHEPVYISRPGPESKLFIVLDPNLRHSVNSPPEDEFSTGFRVYFNYASHEQFINPDPISVQPGTESNIALRGVNAITDMGSRDIYKYFYTPKIPCVDGSYDNPMQFLSGSYSLSACYEDCSFVTQYEICNCTYLGPVKNIYQVCTPDLMYKCLESQSRLDNAWEPIIKIVCSEPTIVAMTYNLDIVFKHNRCQKNCRSPCAETSVTAHVTTTAIGGRRINKLVTAARHHHPSGGQLTVEDLSELAILNIYFSSPLFTFIRRHPRMTIDNFISQIGGLSGLWTGLSLLTVAQFIVYVLKFILLSTTCQWGCRGDKTPNTGNTNIPGQFAFGKSNPNPVAVVNSPQFILK